MRLVIDGDLIKFEPDFKDFEIVLINVYDVMLKAVTIVPRVETKLYSEWVSNARSLKTVVKIESRSFSTAEIQQFRTENRQSYYK
jgi:dynein heavy chain